MWSHCHSPALLISVALLAPAYANAQSSEVINSNENQRTAFDGQLSGIVSNHTVTVLGWDFYQYFTAAWRLKEASDRYSVTIYERPTAIRGSEMWVQYGQRRVFHAFLSPARSSARKVSQQAVEIAYKKRN